MPPQVDKLSQQLENNQIRCNSVHPGDSLTPLVQSASMELAKQRGITYEAYLEQRREDGNPYIEPVDVANAVLFLASDEAKNITGTQLVVDAGNRLD